MSDGLTINHWNNIYSKLPNFANYNQKFSTNRAYCALIVALSTLIATSYLPQAQPLLNRVAIFSGLGVLVAKGLVLAGTSIQRKVWENTDEGKERLTWRTLAPPTDIKTTEQAIRCNSLQHKFENSFPDPLFIKWQKDKDPNAPDPKPVGYTKEHLIEECDQWMNAALAVAKGVYDDLKKWTEEKRFIRGEEPLQKGDLLYAQPGWNIQLHYSPWLYRGFFFLPIAYRYIFTLTNTISKLKTLPSFCQKEAEEFESNYPASNKAALEGWQEQFFIPGTKQSKWREQYNTAMETIFKFVGDQESKSDGRFYKWGRCHEDQDLAFRRSPDTLPT
jgi:hypothetical protein